MKNRFLKFCLLCLLSAIGCDNRDETFLELDTAPIVKFEKQHSIENEVPVLFDSLKISKSNPAGVYVFRLLLQDEENNISHLSYAMESGIGQLEYSGVPVVGNTSISGDRQRVELRYLPTSSLSTLIITIHDEIGKFATAKLELRTFENIAPIAELSVNELKVNNPYEYLIDASDSRDGDEDFGGKILKYRYSINDVKEFNEQDSSVPFIFPGPGTYLVTVVVEDNDNATSEPKTVKFSIEK